MTRSRLPAIATVLSLASRALASRACGANANSTYEWQLGAARYDESDGTATIALSIVPGDRAQGTFFECVAEWPVSWAGWYSEASNQILWNDCIWAGNGQTYDTTVSSAVDWKNRVVYISHTYDCSDQEGSSALAIGSAPLELDCSAATDGSSSSCALTAAALSITTKGAPARLAADSCADNLDRYQSWQLEGWHRQYERAPGSTDPPTSDSGPSFTLRNMANTDVFDCVSQGSRNRNTTFDGTCSSAEENPTTAAEFRFDSTLDVLSVTQNWSCDDSAPFDVTGVGFVQATCSRVGNVLTCSSNPLWIGTKTV
ncbi:hypothetical protein M426DRAFT_12842 [Hypoxylon sp. CI-4A]|nr:hypothetical protein M426DRAFT_12842 [Hypoxylon sp. CI-4A]